MCANFLLIYGSFCSGRTFSPPLPFRTTKASFRKEEGEGDTFPFLLPPLLALCASPFSSFLLLWNVRCPRPPSYFWMGFGWRRRDFFSFLSDARKKGGRENKRGRKDVRIHQFLLAVPKCRGCWLLPAGKFPSPCPLADFLFSALLPFSYYPAFHSVAVRRQLPAALVFAQE